MELTEIEEKQYLDRINKGITESVSFQSRVVSIGILASIVAAGLVLAWAIIDDGKLVQLKDVLTTLLVGFACTTLVYASKTFEHNRYVNLYRLSQETKKAKKDADSSKARLEYEAKAFAFNLMRDWHSAEMIEHGTTARAFMTTHDSDLFRAINDPKNATERASVMVVLNYFERVGLACQTKIADNALMKGYFRRVFNLYFSDAEDYIRRTRKEKDAYKLFEHFENTVKEWRKDDP